ncbi:MAG: toprim domain-containing protein [Thermoplasmata archaeon]
MNLERRDREILETLDELRELTLHMPVIVEGKKDGEALRSLDVEGTIVRMHGGTTVFRLCEALAEEHDEAIILTDWDRRGGQLSRLLREGLAANDLRANTEIRARLARLCKKEVKDVEGLKRLVNRISPPGQ